MEDACKDDAELRAVLGDSIGNPELMRKRVFFFFLFVLYHRVCYQTLVVLILFFLII